MGGCANGQGSENGDVGVCGHGGGPRRLGVFSVFTGRHTSDTVCHNDVT